MPHVTVSLWPGKSFAQKARLSQAIVDGVTDILDYGEESVSVAFVEVSPADWMAKVYVPEIAGQWDKLTKKPGYGPRT